MTLNTLFLSFELNPPSYAFRYLQRAELNIIYENLKNNQVLKVEVGAEVDKLGAYF